MRSNKCSQQDRYQRTSSAYDFEHPYTADFFDSSRCGIDKREGGADPEQNSR